MSNSPAIAPTLQIEQPAHMRASDVKQKGWRGVMRTVRQQGAVVVTNHNEPEAVILGVDRYQALLQAAGQAASSQEAALEALRRDFDERLSVLRSDDAGERLRKAMRKPARLGGKVKAGTGF